VVTVLDNRCFRIRSFAAQAWTCHRRRWHLGKRVKRFRVRATALQILLNADLVRSRRVIPWSGFNSGICANRLRGPWPLSRSWQWADQPAAQRFRGSPEAQVAGFFAYLVHESELGQRAIRLRCRGCGLDALLGRLRGTIKRSTFLNGDAAFEFARLSSLRGSASFWIAFSPIFAPGSIVPSMMPHDGLLAAARISPHATALARSCAFGGFSSDRTAPGASFSTKSWLSWVPAVSPPRVVLWTDRWQSPVSSIAPRVYPPVRGGLLRERILPPVWMEICLRVHPRAPFR
jgi:hypothetical protein